MELESGTGWNLYKPIIHVAMVMIFGGMMGKAVWISTIAVLHGEA